MPSQFDGPLGHSVPVVELLGVSAAQGEKDWQKYETARRLKKCVDRIRTQYREDWKSKEMRIRQRAVALYFIDKVRRDPDHRRHRGALLTQQRPTSQDKKEPKNRTGRKRRSFLKIIIPLLQTFNRSTRQFPKLKYTISMMCVS